MADDERRARIGRNEAIFREVNERMEELNRGFAEMSDRMLHVVCECGNSTCVEQLVISIEGYEEVRGDATHFLVRPGHQMPSAEDVIAEREGYLIVRKQSGLPAQIARESDPRS